MKIILLIMELWIDLEGHKQNNAQNECTCCHPFWKQRKKWRKNCIKDETFLYNIIWKVFSMNSAVDLFFEIDTWRSFRI